MEKLMIPIAQLKKEHAELRELIKTISTLLADQPVKKTQVFSDLFEQFVQKLKNHLQLEDETLYPELLIHEDSHIKNIAARFLSGTRTVNRFFNDYLKNWHNQSFKIDRQFLEETQVLFDFLEKRIAAEEKEFFSVVERKI